MGKKPASRSKKAAKAARPSTLIDTRIIYCGDNLEQLKKLPENSVDLIYIDPPFNSNRNYEVFWGETREKRSFEDRHASTQAYIEFMRSRCVELHRVLKKTGSFYYHCDWHASHYVKIMLDQIFGENQFVNEIIWKRQSAHSDAKQGSKHLGRVHDTIFFYVKGKRYTFKHAYKPYNQEYLEKFYKHVEPQTERRYSLGDLCAPGGAAPSKGNPFYEFLGVERYWRFSREKMQQMYEQGLIVQSKPGAVPRQKRYLDEGKGTPVGTVWDDINPVHGSSGESLGYPTQKPLMLLERILEISSNPNDIVLDAFCGCGTALVAAENLGRQWIGIDVSPTACRVMAKRLRDVCKLPEDEKLWRIGRGFVVRDLPWTEKQLRKIPPFEFENWAVIALGGIPNKAQVGDMGMDGRIFPVSATPKKKKGHLAFMDDWYPIQVKQKDKVGRPDIDSFEAVMMREDRTKGFFVSFDYSADAIREIQAFFKRSGKTIIALTVKDILEEQIAMKLA
ncbi:MAG: restriction endonuclease [Planctomycetes bacterium]|nr:restriction endonuclease [Planctomycetota bacterium]MBL7153157.1 restriction endonuclease [Phycisphaerae bacterium]